MINDTHPEKDQFESVYRDQWDLKTEQELSRYLHAVTKFEFIIYRLLHLLVGITQNFQRWSTDVVKAFNKVRSCIEDMKHVRENINNEFHRIYKQSEKLANKLSVDPAIPRNAWR